MDVRDWPSNGCICVERGTWRAWRLPHYVAQMRNLRQHIQSWMGWAGLAGFSLSIILSVARLTYLFDSIRYDSIRFGNSYQFNDMLACIILASWLTLLWLYFLWSRRRYYWAAWQLPGPVGWPFIGMGLQMMNPQSKCAGNLGQLKIIFACSLFAVYGWAFAQV